MEYDGGQCPLTAWYHLPPPGKPTTYYNAKCARIEKSVAYVPNIHGQLGPSNFYKITELFIPIEITSHFCISGKTNMN